MSNSGQELVEIDRAKLVYTGSSIHWRIPRIIKQKYGITPESRRRFVVRYFGESGSNDIIIRIEKIDDKKRQDDGTT